MTPFTPAQREALAKCTCLWSNTATSSTLYNVDPKCPVHGEGREQ